MPFQDLHPKDALEGLRADPELRILDVRTRPEYDNYHLDGALLVPLQELQARCGELDPDARWLVTCEHGVRSVQACEFLSYMGFGDVRNLQGGMARWVGEQLPLAPR